MNTLKRLQFNNLYKTYTYVKINKPLISKVLKETKPIYPIMVDLSEKGVYKIGIT